LDNPGKLATSFWLYQYKVLGELSPFPENLTLLYLGYHPQTAGHSQTQTIPIHNPSFNHSAELPMDEW
jgi:hypothetical protein